MPSTTKLRALADRWAAAKAAERANAQSYVIELCDALGVEPPRPAGSGYEFEFPIKLTARDGSETQGFVDCYKERHFVLEAKDYEEGRSNDMLLRRAYGQARMYAAHDPSGMQPPYLLVLDVGKTMLVWDRWAGTFGGYAAARRIDLTRLHERPDDAALLVDIWTNPRARDPRMVSQAVTKDIAAHLAQLAASLEGRGFEQERVAKFLMRCVFTMFSEDVGLLPDEPFRRMLDEVAVPTPDEFPGAAEELWRAMDAGHRFGFRKLLKFNGHFFKDAEALPLTRTDLAVLLEAAKADWSKVEPTIFGTLLTRALDPVERHRLGAEYTPPEFIERLIRPTIEEPVRERWTAVQAEVLQLRESKKAKDREKAEERLLEFHAWLRGLKVLDPACGSGNFLYLAMHALKRVEVEVLHELADVRGGALELRMQEVDPSQFYGIEVKPWAREIAELTLWIGFHQFWRQHHGDVQPEEPLLRDTGTLECRDGVMTWRATREDPSRDTFDPTPRLRHPVTGALVPDPSARRPYVEYVDAAQAGWPEADFIVGNPPYLGAKRMREALTDGYVETLRATYPDVPESADYVAYWFHKAAKAVAAGRAIRAGLITTNSITQVHQRHVITAARESGARVIWAAPDHPWIDDAEGAAVRVALTVLASGGDRATYLEIDESRQVARTITVPQLNDDLSPHADVAGAARVPLVANVGLASMGFALHGHGFVVDGDEARAILEREPRYAHVLKPYLAGRDLTQRPRDTYVIDFGYMEEDEARAYPLVFDAVRDRVKPERDANRREVLRRYWWRFGWPRRELRAALSGLRRYIATTETTKHRVFTFLDHSVAADHGIVCIATDDAFVLGVLSSAIHVTWALAAGARLGVGNDPRYTKTACFDPFPFPVPDARSRARISEIAERLDAHRSAALGAGEKVTVTGIYNVVAKLRSGEPLTPAEREVHRVAACGTLRDLHDELDASVASAYGWTWPEPAALVLERLVALHDERAREESVGTVRWVRSGYQAAKFGKEPVEEAPSLPLSDLAATPPAAPAPWPTDAIGQITALRQIAAAGPVTVEEAVGHFAGASKTLVARHLETLAILGEVRPLGGGRYAAALVAA